MKRPKRKIRKDILNKDKCLICFESIDHILQKEEKCLLLNFFNFLKLSKEFEMDWLQQCGKCEIILKRFLSLCNSNSLEKVRLELDYLLEIIKLKMKLGNGSLVEELSDFRKLVSFKCDANIHNPKPQVILTRLSLSNKPATIPDEADGSDDDCSDYDESKCIETMSSSLEPKYTKRRNGTVTCGICKKVYAHLPGFQTHHKSDHQKCQYGCYKCPKTFTRKANVRVHYDRHHLHKQKFKCEFCQRTFGWLNTLKNHRNSVHIKSKLTCDTKGCNRSFLDYNALWYHRKRCKTGLPPIRNPKRTSTDDDMGKRWTCKLCKQEFFSKNRLQHHFGATHLKIRFDCEHCGKKFTTEPSRDNHVKAVHLKNRVCCEYDECNKSFSFRTSLQRHMTSYHGVTGPTRVKIVTERPYHKCEICEKYFRQKGLLDNHMRIHRNKKEFGCNKCECAYNTQSQLNRHFQTHFGPQSYACPSTGCWRSYTCTKSVKRHLETCHFAIAASQKNQKSD